MHCYVYCEEKNRVEFQFLPISRKRIVETAICSIIRSWKSNPVTTVVETVCKTGGHNNLINFYCFAVMDCYIIRVAYEVCETVMQAITEKVTKGVSCYPALRQKYCHNSSFAIVFFLSKFKPTK